MTKARRCYEGHFYLSDWPSPILIKSNPDKNRPIHTECKTIHNVLYSAADAETCGTFSNRKTSIGMQPALIELDHKKPVTSLKTKNSMIEGFVNSVSQPVPFHITCF